MTSATPTPPVTSPSSWKLKPRLVNLHVHDNRGETDEHLPVGRGTIDFPWLLRSLSGYTGRYVIESRGLDDALTSRDRLRALLDL